MKTKLKTLLTLAALGSISLLGRAGETNTITRTVEVSNRVFRVTYFTNTNGPFMRPLTNPIGEPHFTARIRVFDGTNEIGTGIDGYFTFGQCHADDNLGNHVRRCAGWPLVW